MDLPSHGDSPAMEGSVTMERIAQRVYDTLQANRLVVDTVLGHSFGGKVALEIMRMHNNNHLPQLPRTALILYISFSLNEMRHSANRSNGIPSLRTRWLESLRTRSR